MNLSERPLLQSDVHELSPREAPEAIRLSRVALSRSHLTSQLRGRNAGEPRNLAESIRLFPMHEDGSDALSLVGNATSLANDHGWSYANDPVQCNMIDSTGRCFKLLGQRIAKLRRERRLTQEELAEKMAVSRNHIADIELGARNTGVWSFLLIARALGVPPGRMLSGAISGLPGVVVGDCGSIVIALNKMPSNHVRVVLIDRR